MIDYDVGLKNVSGVRIIKAEEGGGTIVLKTEAGWHRIPIDSDPSTPPPPDKVKEIVINHLASFAEGSKKEAVFSSAG